MFFLVLTGTAGLNERWNRSAPGNFIVLIGPTNRKQELTSEATRNFLDSRTSWPIQTNEIKIMITTGLSQFDSYRMTQCEKITSMAKSIFQKTLSNSRSYRTGNKTTHKMRNETQNKLTYFKDQMEEAKFSWYYLINMKVSIDLSLLDKKLSILAHLRYKWTALKWKTLGRRFSLSFFFPNFFIDRTPVLISLLSAVCHIIQSLFLAPFKAATEISVIEEASKDSNVNDGDFWRQRFNRRRFEDGKRISLRSSPLLIFDEQTMPSKFDLSAIRTTGLLLASTALEIWPNWRTHWSHQG